MVRAVRGRLRVRSDKSLSLKDDAASDSQGLLEGSLISIDNETRNSIEKTSGRYSGVAEYPLRCFIYRDFNSRRWLLLSYDCNPQVAMPCDT